MRKSQSEYRIRQKGSLAAKRYGFTRFSGTSHRRRSNLGKRGILKDCIPRMVFPSNRISSMRFILSGGGLWQPRFCLLSFYRTCLVSLSGLGFHRGFCPDLIRIFGSIEMDLSLGHILGFHPSDLPSLFLPQIPKIIKWIFFLKGKYSFFSLKLISELCAPKQPQFFLLRKIWDNS